MARAATYALIWRWHFYAGVLIIPIVLVLTLSGALYLFKPQIERWEERAFQNLSEVNAAAPAAHVEAALAEFPGSRFRSYRLPERSGDAALIQLVLATGDEREVFVSPQGTVVGSLDPAARIIAIDRKLHGQLFLGPKGSWLVELVASWAIVMVVSGLFLWWPSGGRLAGVVWPRLSAGRRVFLRDLHAVTGFWISGLVIVHLATGLPWAGVWGSALKHVRTEFSWTDGRQDWTVGGDSASGAAGETDHEHHQQPGTALGHSNFADVSEMMARARAEELAFPVFVIPPGAPQPRNAGSTPTWTVASEAQNRPLRVKINYDAETLRQVAREDFADKHPIDRVIGYGIAWHEGQLFGWVNQLIGLLMAFGLVTLIVSGFLMWRTRKPKPAMATLPSWTNARGAFLMLIALAAALPLLAISLVVVWCFERFIVPRLPLVAGWLALKT